MKMAIMPELRLILGDNSSEVLAKEASVVNAIATIKQTVNIILFESMEWDGSGDAFSFFPPLSEGPFILLIPLGYIAKWRQLAFILAENKQHSYDKRY
jgi:hypothetical protein